MNKYGYPTVMPTYLDRLPMEKYTLKEATGKIIERIKAETGREVSRSYIHIQKRLGNFKPSSIEFIPYMNRTMPLYTEEAINSFVEWFKTEYQAGRIRDYNRKTK